MKFLDVLIIGCGSIGALKDYRYDSPDSFNILTWAHAFRSLSDEYKVNLLFLDENINKAEQAQKKWGGRVLTNIDKYYANRNIDLPFIIIVAVPTEQHAVILKQIVKYDPDLVIAEKPFCSNLNEALCVSDLYRINLIPIMINYTRKFLPIINEIKNAISTNKLGDIQFCSLLYNRGFKREACHGLNLMNYFFGDFIKGNIIKQDKILIDYAQNDPTYRAVLSFKECDMISITPLDGRQFSIFEIDIIGTKMRYSLIDHGKTLEIAQVVSEPVYGNYNSLSLTKSIFPTDLTKGLLYAAQNAINFIECNESLKCTEIDALNVHKIYDQILND